MGKIRVFLDTDVIISNLLSKTGAASEIVNNSKVKKTISQVVKREIEVVTQRLKLEGYKNKSFWEDISVVSLGISKANLVKNYQEYVFDKTDAHVVAGAGKSKSQFLLTYNLRHYRVDKIKTDLGVVVSKPGNFLQYLRSLN